MSVNYKEILITGGAGFIGSNLALKLQELFPHWRIVVFDKFRGNERLSNGSFPSLGHFKNLIGFQGEIIYGDLVNKGDLENLNLNYNFDIIYHFAAISDTTALEQDLIFEVNSNSFYSILKLALSHKAQLVYASSAATYGNVKGPQVVGFEKPLNAYGFSKLIMDNLAKDYYNKGINIIGLRFFNVYGPNEFFKDKSASTILQFGLQFLDGKSPKLFEGSDEIFRDFVYVKDVINCCILAGEKKVSGIFNVGTGVARTFEDIFIILQKNLSSDLAPTFIENKFKKQYQFFTQADISYSKKKTRLFPTI